MKTTYAWIISLTAFIEVHELGNMKDKKYSVLFNIQCFVP